MRLNFKFMQTDGVPLTADLMDQIQEAYAIFNVIGDIAGNLTILSGCEINGTLVNPGIVVINGDVLFFEGGTISDKVFIHQQDILKTFKNQVSKVLIEKKTVKFGNASVVYNWDEFVRIPTLKEMKTAIDSKVSQTDFDVLKSRMDIVELKTAPIINGGVIWAFGKPFNEIPVGWKEATDYAGKTIVMYDANDPMFSTLGANVGSKTHTLTINEMPAHKHKVPLFANGSASGNAIGHPDNYIDYNRTIDSESIGGSQPHNNIQPSRIANFIEPDFQ